MKLILHILIVFILPIEILAQDISIQGIITDKISGEPLPYAHIYIDKTPIGTSANIEGEFILTIPSSVQANNIIVTYMGYLSLELNPGTINKQQLLTLALSPATTLLKEVEISEKRVSLIEAAIEAIPNNYDYDPQLMTIFNRGMSYREDNPIQVTESVFQIYTDRNKANKKPVQQLKIIKGRLCRDSASFKKIHNINIGYTPASIFLSDFVIQSSLLHNVKKRDAHNFEVKGITQYDNRPAYKIEFDQKDGVEEAFFKGTIYLDTATLAFIRIDIGWSEKGLPYLTETFENKAAAKILGLHKSKWNYRNSSYHYRLHNGKWYLQQFNVDGSFQLIRDKEGLNTALIMNHAFLITDISRDAQPINQDEVAKRNTHMEKQFGSYDPDFWKGFNYQLPDPGFKEIFEDIEKRNEVYRKERIASEKQKKTKTRSQE